MKTQNHESFYTCTNCGHEYNFWDYGYHCPVCLQHNTPTPRPSLLFALCALLFALTTTAQPSPTSQFLITIKTGKTTAVYKNANTATADSLTTIYTGRTTAQLLANTPFYETRTTETWFYIQKKHPRPKSPPSPKSQNLKQFLINNF